MCECKFSFRRSDVDGEEFQNCLLNKTATENEIQTTNLANSNEIAEEDEEFESKRGKRKPEEDVDENGLNMKPIVKSNSSIKVMETEDPSTMTKRNNGIKAQEEQGCPLERNCLTKPENTDKAHNDNNPEAMIMTKHDIDMHNEDDNKAFSVCMAQNQTIQLPGQPQKGKLPSSTSSQSLKRAYIHIQIKTHSKTDI